MKETLCFLKAVIVCLLQCGKWVKLQLAESTPNILEIGSNQDETKKLLQDHEFLLSKLKVRSDKTTKKNSLSHYCSGTTADVAAYILPIAVWWLG